MMSLMGLGLDYSLDDLSSGPGRDSTPVIGHFSSRMLSKEEIAASKQLELSGAKVLITQSDPEKTDKKATERFFLDTNALDECIAQAENLRDMLHNDSMAMKVVGILSYGLRRTGELLADATYKQKMATVERKRMEAIAALDKFGQYLAQKKEKGEDIRVTADVRGHYINIDQDVLIACEKEAFCYALVTQLESYMTQFTMTLSAVKSMISKGRAEQLLSGVATPGDGVT